MSGICWRLGSFRLTIDFWFCFVLCLGVVLDPGGVVLMGMCGAICHELGHIIAMGMLKMKPTGLHLAWTGGRITRAEQGVSYPCELVALIAGSGVNLTLAGVCHNSPNPSIQLFSALNLVMGVFNLLPVRGLDGGSVIKNLILWRFSRYRCESVVATLSVISLMGLWGMGVTLYFMHPENITILLMPTLPTAIFLCAKG